MFRGFIKLQNSVQLRRLFYRNFLSEEFKLTNEWQARLNAPFIKKLNLDTFYYDIEQNFNNQGKTAAIDIDIFANKITAEDEHHLDEISILLHKLRLTEEASNILDSTSHAVVRNFADAGQIIDLLNILDNRLEFGVFLDHYTASYLLDYLIKKRNFLAATKVAAQLMLQEDFTNELSKSLALYACHKFLNNPEDFYNKPKVEENENEKKEEVKVRVKFLRNEFFDDHFDLQNQFHIVGKTLIAISKTLNNNLRSTTNFLGSIYYGKYDICLELLKTNGNELHKDAIEKCLDHLEKISDQESELNESFTNFKASLSNILSEKQFENINYSDELESYVKETVQKFENIEINNQKTIYNEWNKLRELKLKEEADRLNRSKRITEVEKLTQEMGNEEQKLWFFENEDKIDLQIDSKKISYRKRWFGKKKKPRVIDEGYVPPEIVKGRSK